MDKSLFPALKPVRIDFDPWRIEEQCEQCDDFHGGLSVSCNGAVVKESGAHGGGPHYDWAAIIPHILAHLGVFEVSSHDDYEESEDHLVCHTSFPDSREVRRTVQFSGDEPDRTGLDYLRDVLEVAGFKATIFVSGDERI